MKKVILVWENMQNETIFVDFVPRKDEIIYIRGEEYRVKDVFHSAILQSYTDSPPRFETKITIQLK